MNERILRFGPRSALVGVLASPQEAGQDRPAVLMWNVGVNHRVGPYRVFVDLARALVREGFVSLRFDVSGIGDSEPRRDVASDVDPADLDLADAMDTLTRRTGIERFVLVGFCSSVDAAHRVAVKDPRVVGLIQLEGYAFPTRGFWMRFPLRLLSREKWERRLRHTLSQARARLRGEPAPAGVGNETVYKRDYPAWSDYARDVAQLSVRGVAQLMVYVGLDTSFNHVGQFWEMFGSSAADRSRIEIEYLPQADHVFYDVASRQRMMQHVLGFMGRRYPATPALAQAARKEVG